MPSLKAVGRSEPERKPPLIASSHVSDIELLHSISTALITEHDRENLYGKIVDAAVAITGSQFGTMQLLCPEDHDSGHGGELKLLCSRGLPPEAVGFWQWVSPKALSSCTQALKLGKRAVIADFELWPEIAGTEDLLAFRRAGIRSAQTTPLLTREGQLLGMISTHWSFPHQPSERDLRLLDILARQAADLLERVADEETLRARERELASLCAKLLISEDQQRQTEARLVMLNETLEERVAARTNELMQAEGKLRQAQKMEAVGQLTGGLAHDFNNLVAGISGALELMERRISQGRVAEIGKYIALAQSASKRAGSLTHRLLAFSRQQTLEPRPVSVNTLLYGMVDLVQRTVGPGIRIEAKGADDLWPAFVDASQLENALLNLCINARDAMPHGGTVTLATSNQCIDAAAGAAMEMAAGDYLCLCVTDTGAGMPPEVMAHVFEPFFTTKPIGEGTGLGLSMIFGFTQQSGGQVRIHSQLGAGTSVRLYLPRHHGAVASEPAITDVAQSHVTGARETVLLVDDEPTVRMLLADSLSELGYTVIEAADSATGLKLLSSDMPIDLLITDVGLPGGMNGRQMADAGAVVRPGLKTLFITGYAESAALGHSLLQPGMAILAKPFPVQALELRVREMLGKPPV